MTVRVINTAVAVVTSYLEFDQDNQEFKISGSCEKETSDL